MPVKIEGVVSDFAQPGGPGEHAELTLGDMAEMAEKMRCMRLTYEHVHPVHSTQERPITEPMTVGQITDAYIDENDCLHVEALLDDGVVGERMQEEIKKKFLTGFSLGLNNRLIDLGKGQTKYGKDLIELSIVAQPEFAATSFVRIVDDSAVSASSRGRKAPLDGTQENPVRCKLGDLAKLRAERSGDVVAITASSGRRDARTERRSRELLAELRAAEITNSKNYSSGAAAAVRQPLPSAQQQKPDMSQQQPPQQQQQSLVDIHTNSARARHDADVDAAYENGPRFRQAMPRNGVAPIHIHNYVDGTRRGAAQMQQQQRMMAAQRRRNQRQQPPQQQQQQQYDEEIVYDNQDAYYDDNGGAAGGYDDDGAGYDDEYDEPQQQMLPPPPQRRQLAPPPAAQQRRMPPAQQQQQQRQQPAQTRRAPQKKQAPQRRQQYYGDGENAPLPGPEENGQSEAEPFREAGKGGTHSRAEMTKVEKERRRAFKMAGGDVSDDDDELDATIGGQQQQSSAADEEMAEFEAFKKFRAMKQGNAQPAASNKRKAQRSAPSRFEQDADEDVDDKVPARQASKSAAAESAMQKRVSSIKTKLNRNSGDDAPLTLGGGGDDDDDNGALDADAMAEDDVVGGDTEEEFESKAKKLQDVLKIDEHGQSAFAQEFFDKIDELKMRRKKILTLKKELVDARSDGSKKKLAEKLFKQINAMQADYLADVKKSVDEAREFTSKINLLNKRPTDSRTLDTFAEMKQSRGLMTDTELNALGTLVQTVSASSGEMGKTLQSVSERFKRAAIERETTQIRLQEAKRLLGDTADSEAAKRFIASHDPVARGSGGSSASTSTANGAQKKKQAFIVEREDRRPQQASGSYAGYDPVTMLPMGVALEDFDLQHKTGIPYKFVNPQKDVTENTKLTQAFRQKPPKAAVALPYNLFPVKAKRGLWRTGNQELMQAVSASSMSGVGEPLVTPDVYRRHSMHAPPGATRSPDQNYYVLDTQGQ